VPHPTIHRLTSRPQFLAAAKGVSQARGAVVVQRLERGDGDPAVRIGFTATRKVGGAVARNRCKRRLREAARALVPEHGVPGSDYVFIARQGTADRPWERLLDDVKSALTRLATPADGPISARTTPITPDTPPQERGPA
jgi:ribonuclease P protein component